MSGFNYFQTASSTLRSVLESRQIGSDIGIVSIKWPHHAAKSGIWQATTGIGSALPLPAKLVPRVVMRALVPGISDIAEEAAQIIAYCRLTGIRNLVFLNGDLNFPLLNELRKSKYIDKLIGLFHQPLDFLPRLVLLAEGRILDGAICVSTCQLELAASVVVTGGPTVFIPHGVETSYFIPPSTGQREELILSVGNHRRDYEVLDRAGDILAERLPSYRVVFVGKKPEGLPVWKNVEVRSGISDEELLKLYQKAKVLLLPLEEATANNSVLESLSCGTPVVVTDSPGLRDYVGEDCSVLCARGDALAHAQGVLKYIEDEDGWDQASSAARSRSLPLDWKHIQVRYRDFIEQVVGS